jgi:acetyltransferase-like isoleucine patch superfamily enzyme
MKKELFVRVKRRIEKKLLRKKTVELTEEEIELKKMQEDYDFLIQRGVDTEFGYVTLHGKPIIIKSEGSVISMGKGVVLTSKSEMNTAGINHPVIITTCVSGAKIVIGDNVGMSGVSINCVSSCVFRDGVMLGANVNVWDTDFHPIRPDERLKQSSIIEAKSAPILLEKNVWIGANTTILKGVTIGENTVVGAMSLVAKSLPSNSICVGNPASKIRDID